MFLGPSNSQVLTSGVSKWRGWVFHLKPEEPLGMGPVPNTNPNKGISQGGSTYPLFIAFASLVSNPLYKGCIPLLERGV